MENRVMVAPKNNQLVTQSNCLVEARYSLTLYEQRLILIMISMVEPHDEDFKDYVIKVSDFNKIVGINHKGSYNKIKGILRGLRAKELLINQGGKDYLITGWISDAEYKDNEGIILLSFSKKLKPYLLALKEKFTTQRLNTVIKFRGVHTIRIYGLLKQYENIGVREFTLDNFKNILGLEEGQYSNYTNFKRRVIAPALKEFSKKDSNGLYKSDLSFKLEEEKRGRKIYALRFIIIKQDISKKEENEIPVDIQIKSSAPVKEPKIIEDFELLGIKEMTLLPYLEKDGEEALRRILEIFKRDKKAKKIRDNEQGYLVSLLKNGAGTLTESEKMQEEAKLQQLKEEQRRKQEEEKDKEILLLQKAFIKQKKEEYLANLSEEGIKNLFEEVRENYKNSRFTYNRIKDIKSPAIQNDINNILRSLPNFEEEEATYIEENLKY